MVLDVFLDFFVILFIFVMFVGLGMKVGEFRVEVFIKRIVWWFILFVRGWVLWSC